jgi:hypothetical protein
MNRSILWLRASRVVLGATILFFAWTVWHELIAAPAIAPVTNLLARPKARTTVADDARPTDDEIARAIATDAFAPDRSAPSVRYRIARPVTAMPVVVAQPVTLVGTIVSGVGRSFVMAQLGGAPPRVVYPGQTIGSLTLQSVGQGSAVFTDNAGARVVLRTPRAGS